jgi:hypothetical protein
MGNCCPKKSDEIQALNTGNNVRNPSAFHGEVRRYSWVRHTFHQYSLLTQMFAVLRAL